MNVLIITASLRPFSNSDTLASSFARGAKEKGHKVETISLKGKRIAFCMGCQYCATHGQCTIGDDARAIAEKVRDADVLCFAAPVYYYGIPGQLKTLLDRLNPLYGAECRFKEVYYLGVVADDAPATPEKSLLAIQGWIDCFPGVELKDSLFVGGVTEAREIEKNPMLQKAYDLGASIE